MMVNKMRSSSSTARFIWRRPSPSTVALYIIFCFALSILFFLFNTADIVDDSPQLPRHTSKSESEYESLSSKESPSQHQPQAANLSIKVKDELLWKVPRSRGLRPCVKPTS